jgi:hypothetical protein
MSHNGGIEGGQLIRGEQIEPGGLKFSRRHDGFDAGEGSVREQGGCGKNENEQKSVHEEYCLELIRVGRKLLWPNGLR